MCVIKLRHISWEWKKGNIYIHIYIFVIMYICNYFIYGKNRHTCARLNYDDPLWGKNKVSDDNLNNSRKRAEADDKYHECTSMMFNDKWLNIDVYCLLSVFAFIYKRVKMFDDFFLTAFLSRPLQGIDIGSNSVWSDRPYTPLSTLNGSIWRFPSYSLCSVYMLYFCPLSLSSKLG